MTIKKATLLLIGCLLCVVSYAQRLYTVGGTVRAGKEPVANAVVTMEPGKASVTGDAAGKFLFTNIAPGSYQLSIAAPGHEVRILSIKVGRKNTDLSIDLSQPATQDLKSVTVKAKKSETVSGKLRDVAGTAINAGKKTEVIYMSNVNANLATNNTRQIYARIPGLNIWEYDRGGLQLGVGGRGLSPNRSSNFNIRQDGYDISADALGYPESYYNPSAEAIDRIEITRGAASLQYGPHFGGLINFIMKEGPKDKPIEFTSRQSAGSWGFINTFNSLGGTVAKGKLNYYTFYQFKTGDSWRPNSHYDQHNAYAHLAYNASDKLKITGEYTLMKYLAKQPGGLTDAQFAEDPSQSVRARNWFKVDWNLVNLSLDYNISEHSRLNWRNYTLQGGRQALGLLEYINRPDPGGDRDYMSDRYSNYGSELRFIHQYNLLGDKRSTVLVGTRYYHGLTKRKQGAGSDGSDADFTFKGPEPDKSDYDFNGLNYAAFSENIFQMNSHWNITPGVRFEYIDTRADGYYYKQNIFIAPDKIQESKTNPRSFTLLGIGTSWKFDNGTELYGNISQNYRSINFNDVRVVNANARVSPDLKDETGYNADLGFRGNYNDWMYMDVSLFYLKYNDRIGSVFARDSNYMTYRLRTNVSDSRNVGLEVLLEGDILKAITKGASIYKLNVYTNLSLIDARYVNTSNTAIADKLVENVPPLLFRTGVSLGREKWNVAYQFSHQAKQYSDATNTEITPTAVDGAIPAFSVMDLSVSYNWRMLTLYTGINNLSNSVYFTRRADGYPGPGILPADKRNYYVTVQVKL